MVKPRLILVLGDQLTPDIAALAQADQERDIVVMAEVTAETSYVRNHPKKIALVLIAMRKFASSLEEQGWTVAYTRLDADANTGSIPGELLRRADEFGANEVLATLPGEWRLIEALNELPLRTHILPDDRFIATPEEFSAWAKGRNELRMEWFYRQMRRKTGLLMDGAEPVGGRWNYDSENRKPAPSGVEPPAALSFPQDDVTEDVLALVEARFSDNFGVLRPFPYATDRAQALRVLDHFIALSLPYFGDYQDAMVKGDPWLWHSVISPYLNLGLLNPMEVCIRAEEAWKKGAAPLNAVEGFLRQIIGWREFVRGIYFLEGPEYVSRNHLGHSRNLPALFWGAPTRMSCIGDVVSQTKQHAYANHIQRLMITGNIALLSGVAPSLVHDWYLSVYCDAIEWVEAPNTIGISQYADGGLLASKLYVSSGNYINKMSN